ncbi:hypothetical protein C3Y08_16020 [Burkholderia gladioli]|nr:hypothetical protein C3Y08_16020 [Burkholderia gladioli]
MTRLRGNGTCRHPNPRAAARRDRANTRGSGCRREPILARGLWYLLPIGIVTGRRRASPIRSAPPPGPPRARRRHAPCRRTDPCEPSYMANPS